MTLPRFIIVITILLILNALFGLWTWQRNDTWSNEVLFLYDQIDKAPQKIRPYCNLIAALMVRDAFKQVTKIRENMPSSRPIPPPCLKNIAKAYKKMGGYEKAIINLQAATQQQADCTECYQQLASIYLQQNKHAEAKESLLQLKRLQKADANLLALLGYVSYQLGDRESAKEYLQTSLNMDEKEPIALKGMIRLSLDRGDLKEAKRLRQILNTHYGDEKLVP